VSTRTRLVVFAVGALVLAVAYVAAADLLPGFGATSHPYGSRAVNAAVNHRTPNSISSVSFDQRGFDTLGEEFILVLSVVGTMLLLREAPGEEEEDAGSGDDTGDDGAGGQGRPPGASPPDAVRLAGYLMLPLTCLVGGYLVAHGHLSPGGGFQGGVALATGVHLLYLAGDYQALDRFRTLPPFEVAEAVGAGGFVAVGAAALLVGAAFLSNVLPKGTWLALVSAGTVPVLNVAAGVAVVSGLMVLLGEFLEQTLVVREEEGSP